MNVETTRALRVLENWRDNIDSGEGHDIADAIVEWTRDAFEHETHATFADVVRHIETTDCSACHAPHGLIYNADIARKVAEWWSDIDAAIAAYVDATDEQPRPNNGPITVGWLAWFAVEWFANDAASALQSAAGD